MTVLCLVELDGDQPADASLRAVTLGRAFAQSLADTSVKAVVFGDSARVPLSVLADYGVSDVYVIEPGTLDGYAPQAWGRVPAAATRCSPTSARSRACRWPRTARWSLRTAVTPTAWSGTAGPGCCSRTR